MDSKYKKLVEAESLGEISTIADYRNLHQSGKNKSKKLKVLACSAILCLLLVLVSFSLVRLFIHSASKNHQYKNTQTVHSSVADNYVEYFVQVSADERTWILDDFNMELTIFKSESKDQTICYVTKLDRQLAVPPFQVHEGDQPYKDHLSGIYTTEEGPTPDKSFLGKFGLKLCGDVNVYWMTKSDVTDMMDLDDMDEPLVANSSSLPDSHHRDKRRIRQCRASCCWRVCCCDIQHFTWETVELFTCAHICNKCTKQYKYTINKLC